MLNRFRLMERILREIRKIERQTGRMTSAILVIDLRDLKFDTNLIGFLSGLFAFNKQLASIAIEYLGAYRIL